jgi:large subunit ribosomal protein L15
MPLARRVPKRGFHNRFAKTVVVVNVADLERVFAAGDRVTPEDLRRGGLANGRFDLVKVLGNGELTKSLVVSAHRFSRQAADKIRRAGGEVIELAGGSSAAADVPTPRIKPATSDQRANARAPRHEG